MSSPYTYDHEGKEGEADGDNDVLCHVALAEALLKHRLVPAAQGQQHMNLVSSSFKETVSRLVLGLRRARGYFFIV